jgi:hypothetical protein
MEYYAGIDVSARTPQRRRAAPRDRVREPAHDRRCQLNGPNRVSLSPLSGRALRGAYYWIRFNGANAWICAT